MITSINRHSYPNTLIVILGQDHGRSEFDERENVTRVTDDEGNLIGFNFFSVDKVLDYDKLPDGKVELNDDQLAALNKVLKDAGFDDTLTAGKPTIVYGKVVKCEPHPDSDHLHVTQVNVGTDKLQQIVCGAPNVAEGQTVVVALPGALMPNGAQIWPGKLRGVESDGMICAARELQLPHAEQKRGIMVLPAGFEAGNAYEPAKLDELLASGQIKL